MPTPRKPVELLELAGTFRPDRHARLRGAPKSDRGIGDPPACLGPDEAAAWREFVSNAPAGVLTSGDRVALECLAVLIAKARRPGGLSGAELGQLRGFLSEMGASPASRGRVLPVEGGAEAPTGNPWDVPAPGRA